MFKNQELFYLRKYKRNPAFTIVNIHIVFFSYCVLWGMPFPRYSLFDSIYDDCLNHKHVYLYCSKTSPATIMYRRSDGDKFESLVISLNK